MGFSFKRRLKQVVKIPLTQIYRILPEKFQYRLLKMQSIVYRRAINRLRLRGSYYAKYKQQQIQSSAYSRKHPKARIGTEHSVERLLSSLRNAKVVLDAGCGDGYALDLIKVQNLTCVGFDFNLDKLAVARDTGHQLVFVGDIHRISLKANSVDAIHCSHVLEHTLDPVKVLKEFQRVLRADGVALFVVPITAIRPHHPTAFLDQDYIKKFIGEYFTVTEVFEGQGRGHTEVTVVCVNRVSE